MLTNIAEDAIDLPALTMSFTFIFSQRWNALSLSLSHTHLQKQQMILETDSEFSEIKLSSG